MNNILAYIESLDRSFFLGINNDIANPFFDTVFPGLRELTYVFWFLAIVYFLIKKENELALLVGAGIIVGAVFTFPMKYLIDRTRPYDTIESTRLLTASEPDPSFPSGHTELSFLAATVISRYHPEYSKYLYAFSFTVALSRIYVGVHFPIDVIGGVVIGIVLGRMVIALAQKKRDIFQKGEI